MTCYTSHRPLEPMGERLISLSLAFIRKSLILFCFSFDHLVIANYSEVKQLIICLQPPRLLMAVVTDLFGTDSVLTEPSYWKRKIMRSSMGCQNHILPDSRNLADSDNWHACLTILMKHTVKFLH